MALTIGRRRLLVGAGAALVVAPFSSALAEIGPQIATAEITPQVAVKGARTLAFNNIHTGEKLKIDYWVDGNYVPDALQSINHLLRDYRNGQVHIIEPKLLDLLTVLRGRLETTESLEVISGYRSPATNAMLHAESSGVAAKSLHMQGMAIDIRIPGRALSVLHKTALNLRAGGVGYYPASDFVHVDVGRVRHWGGV